MYTYIHIYTYVYIYPNIYIHIFRGTTCWDNHMLLVGMCAHMTANCSPVYSADI